jgi:hypothetical protein
MQNSPTILELYAELPQNIIPSLTRCEIFYNYAELPHNVELYAELILWGIAPQYYAVINTMRNIPQLELYAEMPQNIMPVI